MNAFDFKFIEQREKLALAKSEQDAARNSRTRHGAPTPASTAFSLTADESGRFLHFVTKIPQIQCHNELFQLLQTEEVQHFIPHQVFISAWGDFSASNLKLDVISAIPGMRTGLLSHCSIDGLIKDLYARWLVHGRRPLLLSSAMNAGLAHSACNCVLHKYLRGNWSLLVHGVVDARDGSASLYLALNQQPVTNGQSVERFRLLADSLITQIDVAFRRIAAPKASDFRVNHDATSGPGRLSVREDEVLLWVAEGKTNVEISKILTISPFTVKNHLQRIMEKLDAANRTEAAMKYHQMELQAEMRKDARESPSRSETQRSA